MPKARRVPRIHTCYVLHFLERGQVRHYTGYTSRPVAMRLAEHFDTRKGSTRVRAAYRHGSPLSLTTLAYVTARAARRCELRIKQRGAKAYCNVCRKT